MHSTNWHQFFIREEDSESLATVKNELDDASHVTYVRGQWIYADTGHNGRYKIAGADLPGTGDMAAYLLCGINKNKPLDSLDHFITRCLF